MFVNLKQILVKSFDEQQNINIFMKSNGYYEFQKNLDNDDFQFNFSNDYKKQFKIQVKKLRERPVDINYSFDKIQSICIYLADQYQFLRDSLNFYQMLFQKFNLNNQNDIKTVKNKVLYNCFVDINFAKVKKLYQPDFELINNHSSNQDEIFQENLSYTARNCLECLFSLKLEVHRQIYKYFHQLKDIKKLFKEIIHLIDTMKSYLQLNIIHYIFDDFVYLILQIIRQNFLESKKFDRTSVQEQLLLIMIIQEQVSNISLFKNLSANIHQKTTKLKNFINLFQIANDQLFQFIQKNFKSFKLKSIELVYNLRFKDKKNQEDLAQIKQLYIQ